MSRSSEKVFASVAAVLSDQLLATLPGSRSVFLDTLQRHTGVLCRTSAGKCVVFSDTWHSLKQVNNLLESIADGQPTSKTELQSIIDRQQAVDSHTTSGHVDLWRDLMMRDDIAIELAYAAGDDDDASQTEGGMACTTKYPSSTGNIIVNIHASSFGEDYVKSEESDEDYVKSEESDEHDMDTLNSEDNKMSIVEGDDTKSAKLESGCLDAGGTLMLGDSQEQCVSCSRTFENRVMLLNHLRIFRRCFRQTEEYCIPTDLRDQLALMKKVKTPKCPQCKKKFRSVTKACTHYALGCCDKRLPQIPSVELTEQDVDFSDMDDSTKSTKPGASQEQCVGCSRTFENRVMLLKHMKIFLRCFKKAETDCCIPTDLRDQMALMKKVTIRKCPKCHKIFSSIADACIHYALGCSDKPLFTKKLYTCLICNYTSKRAQGLRDHKARLHSTRSYTCTVCKRSYGSERILKEHKERVHTIINMSVCHICGQAMRAGNMKKHLMRHDGTFKYKAEPAICDICGFRSEHGLAGHYARKHGDRKITCPECTMTFALAKDLRQHTRHTHNALSSDAHRVRVQCQHCGKSLRKKNLDAHVKHVHNKVREHGCTKCGRLFQTNDALNSHMQTHIPHAERTFRYTCLTCKYGTNNRTMYVDHVNKHTGERPYECNKCGNRFKHFTSRYKHVCKTKPKATDVADTSETNVDSAVMVELTAVEAGTEDIIVFREQQFDDASEDPDAVTEVVNSM